MLIRISTGQITEEKKNFTRNNKKQTVSEYNKSGITDHAAQENNVINWTEPNILESNYKTTTIREAMDVVTMTIISLVASFRMKTILLVFFNNILFNNNDNNE